MINCAIVGATGLVGRTFLKILEEKNIQLNYDLFASKKSEGKKITFFDNEYIVHELKEDSFENKHYDFALFSAGNKVSQKYVPLASKTGCVVIDNSSFFRMDADVPLIIPEINMQDAKNISKNIIANPNCSTIQAAILLNPIHKLYSIKRVVFSTYQAVSGAGKKAIDDLTNSGKDYILQKFDYPIINNCIPQIDVFLENSYTKEEIKMIEETKKILHDNSIKITATCIRVPVINCHGESINIETNIPFKIEDIKQLLSQSDGVAVLDDIQRKIYPLSTFANGKDEVFVGRIRRDYSVENGINLWCVADNLRKGAATNAVQILQNLL